MITPAFAQGGLTDLVGIGSPLPMMVIIVLIMYFLVLRPQQKRGSGTMLKSLAEKFRALAVPVIGRIEDDALVLDLRCLEDAEPFLGHQCRKHQTRSRSDFSAVRGDEEILQQGT